MRTVIYVPCTQLITARNMSDDTGDEKPDSSWGFGDSKTTKFSWDFPRRYLFGGVQALQLIALLILIIVHADNRLVMYEEETTITVKAITFRANDDFGGGKDCALRCDKEHSGYCPDSGFIGGSSRCSSESDPGIEIMPEVVYRYTQGIKAGGDLVTNTEIEITHASNPTTEADVLAIAASLDSPFALESTMSADYHSLCLPEPGDVSTYNNMAMVLPLGSPGLIGDDVQASDVNTTLFEAGCLRVGVIATTESGKSKYAVCVFADDRTGDTSYQKVDRTHIHKSLEDLVGLNSTESNTLASKLGLAMGGKIDDKAFDPLQSRNELWGKHQLLGKVCQWSRGTVNQPVDALPPYDAQVFDDDAALVRFAYLGASDHYYEHIHRALGGAYESATISVDGAPVPCRWSLLPVTLPLVSSRFASRMVASPRPAHGLYETPYGGVVSPSAGGCGALRPPIAWGVRFNESTAAEKHDCAHECGARGGQISADFWYTIVGGVILFAISTFMLILLYLQVDAGSTKMRSTLKVLLFFVCVAGSVYIAYLCIEELVGSYEKHALCAFENVNEYIEENPLQYEKSQDVTEPKAGPRMMGAAFGMYVAVATFYVALAGISITRSCMPGQDRYFLVQSNLF